jgi:hypothetical protein
MLRLVTDYAGEKFRRFVHEFKMRKIKYKFLNTAKNIVRLSNHDLHDFLTKYYFEGELWERDMNENFGIRNKAEYYKFFAKYFEISYIDTYTPDYLKNLWTRDFQMLEGGFPFSHILLKGIKLS